ncbi:MAG: hypothetical protein AB1757_08395 [Acidobacteriota bacterium]
MQDFSEEQATPLAPTLIEAQHLEKEIAELRNQISELALQVDAFKARKGGAVGGAIFLLLLAAIATYDLLNGKTGVWLSVGITPALLQFLAVAFAVIGFALLAYAWISERRRGELPEAKLAKLEDELERLLIRQAALEAN